MPSFQAIYYRAADGSEPVRELLESLDVKRRVSHVDNHPQHPS
jgi:hypothetical protein